VSDDEVAEFIAIAGAVGHRLNNILFAIASNAQLANDELDVDESLTPSQSTVRAMLRKIESIANQGHQHVELLLEQARVHGLHQPQ
jgi:hypothetical protein